MASLNTRKPALPPQGGSPPRLFEPSNTLRTHEGAPAARISPELALRRSVCSCLLWEDSFYESGQDIAARITELAGQVTPSVLADLAVDARSHFNLRHVPLLLCAVLARTGAGTRLVGDTLARTIQRADELSEFLAVYAKVNGVEPKALKKKLSAQVKKGLATAFGKFDHYQLAKYFSPSGEAGQPIKARDVMFLVHPKPRDAAQAELWKQLVAGKVKSADTWEVGLSAGPAEGVTKEQHKKDVFEGQLREGKLGYLALLRNLRNMTEAKVDTGLITDAIIARRGRVGCCRSAMWRRLGPARRWCLRLIKRCRRRSPNCPSCRGRPLYWSTSVARWTPRSPPSPTSTGSTRRRRWRSSSTATFGCSRSRTTLPKYHGRPGSRGSSRSSGASRTRAPSSGRQFWRSTAVPGISACVRCGAILRWRWTGSSSSPMSRVTTMCPRLTRSGPTWSMSPHTRTASAMGRTGRTSMDFPSR